MLSDVLQQIGEGLKESTIRRLRRGVDVDGVRLAPKLENDGKPPGVSVGRGLFPLLERARITVSGHQVKVSYHEVVESYHVGEGAKRPRKIIGVDAEDRKRIGEQIQAGLEGSDAQR